MPFPVDVANKIENPGRKLSAGFPDLDRNTQGILTLSSTKSIELLGIKYRSLEDTTKDMLDDFTRRGF